MLGGVMSTNRPITSSIVHCVGLKYVDQDLLPCRSPTMLGAVMSTERSITLPITDYVGWRYVDQPTAYLADRSLCWSRSTKIYYLADLRLCRMTLCWPTNLLPRQSFTMLKYVDQDLLPCRPPTILGAVMSTERPITLPIADYVG
ncbi:hypothetical protein Tcan_05172 [Toxocara canis]|uniref:Uncharacterized protein n=1 Tax=Toxocara canis TaxID=6265 RepID=A0A0B2V3R7_TOXCA|nr:hypothetical protein Tcan_05172 [Toxocara canis]